MNLALFVAAGLLVNVSAQAERAGTSTPAGASVNPASSARQAIAAAPELPWWEGLGDAQLRELIQRALQQNADVQAAALRSTQAEANAWQQLAPTLPVLRVQASGNGAPTESLGFQFGGIPRAPGAEEPPDIYYTGSAFLVAQANIDLGRSITAWSASRKEATAVSHDADALAASLALQVAQTYFDLQTARAQVAVLREQQQTNQSLLSLTELRFSRGTADGLDVLQQKQQVAASGTRIPPAVAREQILTQTLRVLVGSPPNDTLPISSMRLPAPRGIPSEFDLEALEERIPELRAAAERVRAAKDRVRSAQLAFLPTLGVNGQVGQQGIAIDEVNSQNVWGVGASLSLPLLEGGRKWSAWKSAEAALASAEAQQKQLRLRVQQNVANARAQDDGLIAQTQAAQEQTSAATDAMRLAQERYAAGLSNYQALLLAVNASQNAQLALLDTQRQSIQARIRYLNAIGGAWSASLATASSRSTP